MDGIISGKIEKNPDAINFVPDDNYVFVHDDYDINQMSANVPKSFDYQSEKWYLKITETSGQISLLHVKYISWSGAYHPRISTSVGICAFYMSSVSDTQNAIHATASNSSINIMDAIANIQLGTLS